MNDKGVVYVDVRDIYQEIDKHIETAKAWENTSQAALTSRIVLEKLKEDIYNNVCVFSPDEI